MRNILSVLSVLSVLCFPVCNGGGVIMQHPFAYSGDAAPPEDYTTNLVHRWYADADVTAASIIVSGAGTSAANGTYAPDGAYQNYPVYYPPSALYYLYFDNMMYSYAIGDSVGGVTTYYGTYDMDIDAATWYTDSGSAPAPSTAYSGGIWADEIGSSDLRVFGDAEVATATPGLTMDGTVDYAIGPNISELASTSDFSITFWFRTSSSSEFIISYSANEVLDPSSQGDLYIIGQEDIQIGGIGGRTQYDTNQVLNDGSWHFVAVTKNSTNGYMYVDGNTTAVYSWSHSNNAFAYTSATWRIGDNLNGSFFTGDVDDVRIYDATLTGEQAAQIYTATSGSH